MESLDGDKIWIKLKKEFFNFSKDLYINFYYASPSTSDYVKNLDYDIFQKLEEDISKYSADGNVVIAGDLNAKTGTLSDSLYELMDDYSPVNDIVDYSFDRTSDTRQNSDKHPVDKQGEIVLGICKNHKMRILNGRTRGDRTGKFTRYPLSLRETRSTLDYMIADTELLDKVKYFTVLQHLGLSDHECLSLSLKTKGFTTVPYPDPKIIKERPVKYASNQDFLMKLTSPLGKEKLENFVNIYSNSTASSVEEMTADLVDIINTASSERVNVKENKRRTKSKKKCKNKSKNAVPWFTSECRKLKGSLNRAGKEYRKDPFDIKKKKTCLYLRNDLSRFVSRMSASLEIS